MEALARRPVVVVEDHLYHIDRLIELLAARAPELLERVTVLCLDRSGPDTSAAVERWAEACPELQILADAEPAAPARQRSLPAGVLRKGPSYARCVAELLAPRGLLVQDIQLETLQFIASDRWWESIYLANTVRGMYAERPPQCIFLSNKKGFHATFGKDLLDVGFDPRDVLHKDELDEALVPLLRRRLRESFPLELREAGVARRRWLTRDAAEAEALAEAYDLVLWDDRESKLRLSGRALAGRKRALELASGSNEAETWRELVAARIDGEPGVSTREVGERLAPELALAAEQSNAAARHIYALRKRLRPADALLTVDHHYSLAEELRVAWISARPRPSSE